MDGTFSVSPLMFVQLFAIHGLFKAEALPLVYALLTHKTQELYSLVLQKLKDLCESFHINLPDPAFIVSDFEMAIINSCKNNFVNARRRLSFFHLGQNVYRKVQEVGLQAAYADPDDRDIKTGVHMLLSLAFVPPEDVIRAFETLRGELLEEVLPIADYFENTYVRTRAARTRRPAHRAPLYPIIEWNQYETAITTGPRTNNTGIMEGWHFRFNALVGKPHPSFYQFLRELQKEQRDTEVMVSELSLGRRIKFPQHKKYRRIDASLREDRAKRELAHRRDTAATES